MTISHPIQCRCGTVRGGISGEGVHNRVVCYCADCRAFARYLGRAADVLDAQGGTEVVAITQSRLGFTEGADRLAAVRLSEKGMIRWYAACCNTPIGNTTADPKVGFIGVIHACLDRGRMDADFGTKVAVVNTATALGEPKPVQRGLFRAILLFIRIVLTARFSGSYRHSPLFDASGSPRVVPTILRAQELARLKTDV